jgi:hypothetical protein
VGGSPGDVHVSGVGGGRTSCPMCSGWMPSACIGGGGTAERGCSSGWRGTRNRCSGGTRCTLALCRNRGPVRREAGARASERVEGVSARRTRDGRPGTYQRGWARLGGSRRAGRPRWPGWTWKGRGRKKRNGPGERKPTNPPPGRPPLECRHSQRGVKEKRRHGAFVLAWVGRGQVC